MFRGDESGIRVALAAREVDVLRSVPGLLRSVGDGDGDPAAGRLDYRAHPDDPDAERGYRDLVDGLIEREREEDRARFAATLGATRLTVEEADAWLRVIGEARLVLAARLGIDDDGWGDSFSLDEPVEMSLLRLLGSYQDELVEALLGLG